AGLRAVYQSSSPKPRFPLPMSNSDLSDITKRLDRVDEFTNWLAQNLFGATWKKRITILLVVFATFGSRAVLSTIPFLGDSLPSWYSTAYWCVNAGLFLLLVALAAKSLPRFHIPTESGLPTVTVRGLLPFGTDDKDLFSKLQRGVELQRVIAAVRDPSFH